jgi:hypothetical protein
MPRTNVTLTRLPLHSFEGLQTGEVMHRTHQRRRPSAHTTECVRVEQP